MSVLPEAASAPTRLDLPAGAILRPMVSSDAELLHAAIGEHRSWLSVLLPEGDPSSLPGASLGDDLRAAGRLAASRHTLVYLLVDGSWSEALGAFSVREDAGGAVVASWWVVPALQASRIEEELDAYVRLWLRLRWALDAVDTPDNPVDSPAAVAGANLVPLLPEAPEGTPLPEPDRASARVLWEDYRRATAGLPEALPPVESFGDSVEMADELLALVRRGVKTATTSLAGVGPVSLAGGHWIVCDGSGEARVVLRTEEVRLGSLESVDEEFAWAEGERDRSRDSWLEGHLRSFARESPGGIGDVVFERFRVVWPVEDASRADAFARSPAADPALAGHLDAP